MCCVIKKEKEDTQCFFLFPPVFEASGEKKINAGRGSPVTSKVKDRDSVCALDALRRSMDTQYLRLASLVASYPARACRDIGRLVWGIVGDPMHRGRGRERRRVHHVRVGDIPGHVFWQRTRDL